MQASVRNAAELLKQMGQEFVEQEGVDLVIECTGAPPCIQMGLYTVKPKGRFVQVGMGSSDVLMPLWRINQKVSGSRSAAFLPYSTHAFFTLGNRDDWKLPLRPWRLPDLD